MDRSFGEYLCMKCGRGWMSANSWAGYGQDCKSCGLNVMPHKLSPIEKVYKYVGDPKKEHPQELCGKCRARGYFCGLD